MIISTVIMVACFGLILFELVSVFSVFRSCRNVRCTVDSSEKVLKREEGFLVREYWKTTVGFELDGVRRSAVLETSTFCQKGQVLGCYYYPKRDLVFRKRDVRRVFRAHSIQAFSIGVLFLLLILIFRMTALGGIIIAHTVEAVGVLLILPFTGFGVGFIVYAVNALRHTQSSRVTTVNAKIVDIVRRSRRHRENERFTYYPVYSYKLGGFEHTVTSKLGRETPPRRGSFEHITADAKKGGPVEYKDVTSSFVLGICFLIIAGLLLYAVAFM